MAPTFAASGWELTMSASRALMQIKVLNTCKVFWRGRTVCAWQ